MAFNVKILPTAHNELTSEVAYLLQHSKPAAARLIQRYRDMLDALADGTLSLPLSRMPELASRGYHTAFIGDYLFLYYIEKNDLVVAHFFHQRQDYASLVTAEDSSDSENS